jgi:hypothetical protein
MIELMQKFIMQHYRVFAIRVVLFFTICVLSGCSAVRLGYNHGESLTYWWLNSYIDFDGQQRPWVKKDIEKLFAWHRKTQLHDYAQFMAHSQKQLQHKVDKQELLASYDEIKKRSALVVDKALPELADLALSLQPQQIAHIEKKFASNNDKYRKDYLHGDIEQRQSMRYKKVMEQAEYWFGGFSPEQEALIRRASDARPLDSEIWLAERQHRQQEMIALLKKIQAEKPSREATMQLLKNYAGMVFDQAGSGQHEQFLNASKDATAGMAAVIINCTTPAQKAKAVNRLQQWIDNFNVLAAPAS